MRRTLFVLAMGVALAAVGPALAQHDGHAGHGAQADAAMDQAQMLASSTPADGAVLAQAPRTIALTFAHPVMLQTVAITGPDGSPVRATFRRPNAATAHYSIALPSLASGAYQARWAASGMGHDMAGAIRFTVQ
jgi:methionine-rich copper-binding protein CopC